jgi:putative Mg2+ transporter-C (MgtC) family protein
MITPLALEIARNLLGGWLAGLLIGLERTYNGRAAGFRTHALVGLAAAATATLAMQPMLLLAGGSLGAHPLDPTRLGQGVMTGIGFLGAGVIFKEGVSVQGLTTAASIWATAAVGLLFGIGMPYAGIGVTALILVTLVVFRWVENVVPWRVYALAVFRFEAAQTPSEAALCELLGRHSVSLKDVSYKLLQGGQIFEYSTSLQTRRQDAFNRLSERLRTIPGLVEYEVSRISK